ncbi:unnamed protein product [Bemisia tabaci]|uniref:WD repeat-containing protein 55 homolog n=1 Tax=Bemisia tabaci TaxID=7038 RepID=A0A9P0A315_BEMTA|nr:unnamed protein product [Bemisia tabaci]
MIDAKEMFEIIVGTYEEYVISHRVSTCDGKLSLTRVFASHSHQGSVNALAAKDKWIASGGADDRIELIDMESRTKECSIQHEDTITSLSFTPDGVYLIAGSKSGNIALLRVSNWKVEKVLSSNSGIQSISIHPSGKLALSVGHDGHVITWDLVNGKEVYKTNIGSVYDRPGAVVWSPDGSFYAIPVGHMLEIYSISSRGKMFSQKHDSKITCCQFLNEGTVCFGDEDGTLSCLALDTLEMLWELRPSEVRVKHICVCKNTKYLAAAFGDGSIKLYDFGKSKSYNKAPKLEASTSVGARITCLVIYEHISSKKKKQKLDESLVKKENVYKKSNKRKNARVKCFPRSSHWTVTCS